MSPVVNLFEYERLAKARMAPMAFDYYASGAMDEITVKANHRAAALERIGTLRNEGRGWGNISKQLGFKLGPVVSDTRHSLNDLRRDLRAEQKAGKVDKAANPSDMKGEMRVEHIERGQRPERPEKPDRNGR
jgi:hypothetical protein